MHANHFRRLALAQGLLPSQHAPAPEPDDRPGTVAADAATCVPLAEQVSEAVH